MGRSGQDHPCSHRPDSVGLRAEWKLCHAAAQRLSTCCRLDRSALQQRRDETRLVAGGSPFDETQYEAAHVPGAAKVPVQGSCSLEFTGFPTKGLRDTCITQPVGRKTCSRSRRSRASAVKQKVHRMPAAKKCGGQLAIHNCKSSRLLLRRFCSRSLPFSDSMFPAWIQRLTPWLATCRGCPRSARRFGSFMPLIQSAAAFESAQSRILYRRPFMTFACASICLLRRQATTQNHCQLQKGERSSTVVLLSASSDACHPEFVQRL